MKKISKISISHRGYRKKKYFKLFFAVLICIFIIAVTVLIKFYFDVNDETSNVSFSDNNIIANLDNIEDEYKIFRNDNGLLGVKNADDRNIIEPEWNNIYFLNSGRFAVQKKNDKILSIGIIDSDENCITPFIFDKIISIGKNFLAGYLSESNEKEFVLLSPYGLSWLLLYLPLLM